MRLSLSHALLTACAASARPKPPSDELSFGNSCLLSTEGERGLDSVVMIVKPI